MNLQIIINKKHGKTITHMQSPHSIQVSAMFVNFNILVNFMNYMCVFVSTENCSELMPSRMTDLSGLLDGSFLEIDEKPRL